MYMNGQIIFDLDNNRCVKIGDDSGSSFAWGAHPKHNTHIICVQHEPKYIDGSEASGAGMPQFKCDTCGSIGYHYTFNYPPIWIGNGYSLKQANALFKAGKIAPSETLEQHIAKKQQRSRIETKEEANDRRIKERREYIDRNMKIALDFRALNDEYNVSAGVRGRNELSHEFGFRNKNNMRIAEQARKEYELRILALQNEIRAKYEPRFIKEEYKDIPLMWPERKAIVDEVWNTPELKKMRGRVL